MPRVPYSPQKPFLLKRLHLSAAYSVPRHESSWCSPKKGLVLMASHVDQHDHGTLLNTIYTQPQTPLWVNPLEGLEGSVHYLLSHSACASYDARPGVLFRLIASHPIRDSCKVRLFHIRQERIYPPHPQEIPESPFRSKCDHHSHCKFLARTCLCPTQLEMSHSVCLCGPVVTPWVPVDALGMAGITF